MTGQDQTPERKLNGHAHAPAKMAPHRGLNGDARPKPNVKKPRRPEKRANGQFFSHKRERDGSAIIKPSANAIVSQDADVQQTSAGRLSDAEFSRLKTEIYQQIREELRLEIVREAKDAAVAAGKGVLHDWEPKQSLIDYAAHKAVNAHIPDLKNAAADTARDRFFELKEQLWERDYWNVWKFVANLALIISVVTGLGYLTFPFAKSMIDDSVKAHYDDNQEFLAELESRATTATASAAIASDRAGQAVQSIGDLKTKSEKAIGEAERLVKAADDVIRAVGKGGVQGLIKATEKYEKIAPEIEKILSAGSAVAGLRTELNALKIQVKNFNPPKQPKPPLTGAAEAVGPPTTLMSPTTQQPSPAPKPAKPTRQIEDPN